MKRFLLIALLAACAAGCKDPKATAQPEPTPEPLAERSRPPSEADSPSGFIGVLTPKAQAEVVAPFTANVKEYAANLGDHVEAGAVLAVLDEAPLKEMIDKAAADLRAAQASAASAASAARIAHRAFEAGVSSKANATTADFAYGEAAARVEGAKAAFDAAKQKIAKKTLTAPMAGKIALQYAKAGTQVAEGSPVIKIISSDELFVKFAIPTNQVDAIAVGNTVDVSIDSNGKQLTAKAIVKNVAPELDPVARMIFAEAELTGDQPAGLQAGLVCRIKPQGKPSGVKPASEPAKSIEKPAPEPAKPIEKPALPAKPALDPKPPAKPVGKKK